jgi:hypothetical protein
MNPITKVSSLLLVVAACAGKTTVAAPGDGANVTAATADASPSDGVPPQCPANEVSPLECAGQEPDGGCVLTWSQALLTSDWCWGHRDGIDSLAIGCGYGLASIGEQVTYYFDQDSGVLTGAVIGLPLHCTQGNVPDLSDCDVQGVVVTSCDASGPTVGTSGRPHCSSSLPSCVGETLDGSCVNTWSQVLSTDNNCQYTKYDSVDGVWVGCGYGVVDSQGADTSDAYYFDLDSGMLVGEWFVGTSIGMNCVIGYVPEGGLVDCDASCAATACSSCITPPTVDQ